jgi:esterase/lipase
MTQEALLYVMAAAVGLAAIAMVVQAFLLYAMSRSARAIKDRLDQLTPRAESLMESSERTLEQSRKQVAEIMAKANEILATTRVQVGRADEFLAEATQRARIQMDRVELVLDDSISRIHETVTVLNTGILRPLREINGISVGIRSALSYLLRGGRPNVAQATTDEEMFI